MNNEIWKDISGYEGLYQVSNLGNIRALTFHNNVCFKKRIHLLKQHIDRYGRYRIKLCNKGKYKLFQVHQLVAIAFLQKKYFKSMPYENRKIIDLETLEVNHKDENPLNNRAENLEWCTRSYNMHYGNIRKKIEEKRKYKKVNQYDLNGNFIKTWNKVSDITNTLKISRQSISYCCNGKCKTASGYVWRYINE